MFFFSIFFYGITEAIIPRMFRIPNFKSNVDDDINKMNKYEEDNGNENRGKPETGVYYRVNKYSSNSI